MHQINKIKNYLLTLSNNFALVLLQYCALILSLRILELFFCFVNFLASFDEHKVKQACCFFYTNYLEEVVGPDYMVDGNIDFVGLIFALNSTYIILIAAFVLVLLTPPNGVLEIGIKKNWFYVTLMALVCSLFNFTHVCPLQVDVKELESLIEATSNFDTRALTDASRTEYVNYIILSSRKIGLLFCLLVTYIFVLCAYSKQTVCTKTEVLLYISLEYFLLKAFSTLNLLEFYIYFEAVLIPMYLLIIGWGSGESKKGLAAYYLVFYTIFFSIPLLIAILYLGDLAQSFNILAIRNIKLSWDVESWLLIALFLGFAVKVPIFPFHTWLPEAHVNASTTASVVLASLLLKLGGYGMIVFLISICSNTVKYYLPIIYVFLVISIIYSSMVAIVQTDLKRIIAYSSIAHMNLSIVGIFCNNIEGLIGSVFQMISHGITSAGLFFLVGFIYDRHHTRDVTYYGGLAIVMPLFSIFFFIFTLGNISFPGTSSFVGELLLLLGVYKHNTVIAVLSLSGSFLCTIYSIWTYNRVCYGSLNTSYLGFRFFDLNRQEFVIMLYLLIPLILLGIFPNILIDYLWDTKYFFFKEPL